MFKLLYVLFGGIILLMVSSFSIPEIDKTQNLKILFVNPYTEYTPVWKEIEEGVVFAAHEKGVELNVFHANNDVEQIINLLKKYKSNSNKPDYVILSNYRKMGGEMLKILANTGIKVYFIKDAFTEDDGNDELKKQYPFWIGTLLVDYKYINECIINELRKSEKYEETVFLFSSLRNNYSTVEATKDFQKRIVAEVNHKYFIDRNIYNIEGKNPQDVILRLIERDNTLTSIIIDNYNVANKICIALRGVQRKIAVSVNSYDSSIEQLIRNKELLMAFAGYQAFGQIAIHQLSQHFENSAEFREEINVRLVKINDKNIDEFKEIFNSNSSIIDKFVDIGKRNSAYIFSYIN